MNKKLVAVAVAGALAAPMVASAADSSVTLFGRVGAEYGSTKIDQASNPAQDYRQETIGDNTGVGRWGMKISEDLGNGLKANARIEFAIRAGNGVIETAREQWVGLSSKSWGEVQFGRLQSPFKDFAGGATLDPFNTTNIQARGAGGALYAPSNGLGAGSFVDHAIRYNSPEFGGFSAAVILVPVDATQTAGNATNSGGNIAGKGGSSNYQIGLKYKFGKTGEVFGGYSNDDANDAYSTTTTNGRLGDDEEVWRIGGAVNFGDFRLAGQYDNIRNAQAGNGGVGCGGGAFSNGGETTTTAQCNTSLNANGDGDVWFLTAQYKIGKTTLVVQGGRTKADRVTNATTGVETANERKASNITLGAIYNFSKRTRVFGGYQKVDVKGARDITNTTATGTGALAVQPDRSTWTVGMRHDF